MRSAGSTAPALPTALLGTGWLSPGSKEGHLCTNHIRLDAHSVSVACMRADGATLASARYQDCPGSGQRAAGSLSMRPETGIPEPHHLTGPKDASTAFHPLALHCPPLNTLPRDTVIQITHHDKAGVQLYMPASMRASIKSAARARWPTASGHTHIRTTSEHDRNQDRIEARPQLAGPECIIYSKASALSPCPGGKHGVEGSGERPGVSWPGVGVGRRRAVCVEAELGLRRNRGRGDGRGERQGESCERPPCLY